MKTTSLPSKKGIYSAMAGSILVALCCFTPILVLTLGAVGLSALTPYLDYVLLPALVMLIVLAIVSYGRWKRACKSGAKELVG
jgi:mercuric ion transport protein